MAKTRTELDAELDELAAWMPAMLAETADTDQIDAFAGRAGPIEAAAGPDDTRHVHERLQHLLAVAPRLRCSSLLAVPDFAADPKGKVTPLTAHIRLANPRTPATEQNRLLRRPFNYANGVTKAGQLDMGLLFIAYQADLEQGFITVQRRLDGEPLEEYVKPVGGGYFFTLPGVAEGDYLGRPLLAAAAAAG